MTPCLLALDTSTDRLAAALQAPAGRWCVDEAGGAAASARLVPLLMGLLDAAGIVPAQLQAIAFGRGPGAFTGLRTACAVTQGLAFAHDTPVLAVDSLLIVAEQARALADAAGEPVDGPWWVAMDARMDEVYAAAYQHRPDTGWQTELAPRLWTLPALAGAWADALPQRVTGNATAAFGERVPTGAAAVRPPGSARAAALLTLAGQAWARGDGLPADQALPLYLRDKVALTTAERLVLRAARTASGEPA